MAAVAYQARFMMADDLSVLAMGDARMQEVYWAYFSPNMGLEQADIKVSPVDTVQVADKSLVIAGWGLEQIQLPYYLQDKLHSQYAIYPKAQTLIPIVQQGKIPAMTAAEALPIYIRNQVTS